MQFRIFTILLLVSSVQNNSPNKNIEHTIQDNNVNHVRCLHEIIRFLYPEYPEKNTYRIGDRQYVIAPSGFRMTVLDYHFDDMILVSGYLPTRKKSPGWGHNVYVLSIKNDSLKLIASKENIPMYNPYVLHEPVLFRFVPSKSLKGWREMEYLIPIADYNDVRGNRTGSAKETVHLFRIKDDELVEVFSYVRDSLDFDGSTSFKKLTNAGWTGNFMGHELMTMSYDTEHRTYSVYSEVYIWDRKREKYVLDIGYMRH